MTFQEKIIMRKSFHQKLFMTLSLFFIVFILFLTGCGPIYDTRYHYTPPQDPQGMNCIFQCDNMKMQCEQLEMMRYENCMNRAKLEQDRCLDNIRRQNREPKKNECPLIHSCSQDTERCDVQYRICYQNCGGQVHAEQVCVFNCP